MNKGDKLSGPRGPCMVGVGDRQCETKELLLDGVAKEKKQRKKDEGQWGEGLL